MHLSSPQGGLGRCPFKGGGSVVVDLLFNVLPIICESYEFVYVLFCVDSSFAITLKRKRRLIALLLLSYRCIVAINVL